MGIVYLYTWSRCCVWKRSELYATLTISAPRIWYVSPFAKPHGRDQPFRTNSTISYKVVNWHSSPPLRRETASIGSSFLHGSCGCGSKLFLSFPLDTTLAETTTRCSKVRATAEREGPGFCRYSTFCKCFQEKVKWSLHRSLSNYPPLTEHSSPHSPTVLIPPVQHPLTVIISLCYPTPCSIYVVSSGPLWPTFYHCKL